MFTVIVVLLLLAALLGVLGAVLKVVLVLVLGFVLAVIVLAWGAWWWLKRRVREFEREVDRQREVRDRRRRAIDVRHVPNEADETTSSPPRELTEGDLP